jgi:MerR family transcriptional regulator, copper efflux regulator
MTLREAAERTDRSVTTLRRYIRNGRLRAEMREGRYGPEYFVSPEDLAEAGLDPGAGTALALPRAPVPAETVPVSLFQELQMKHEQLLVQYGMVRAAGMRVMDLQAQVEEREAQAGAAREEAKHLRDRLQKESGDLRGKLRARELELEGRSLEIAALREKVRALEMLTRNAVTNESIERQFGEVMEQMRLVDRLRAIDGPPRPEEPGH